jgi:hypothetical protein
VNAVEPKSMCGSVPSVGSPESVGAALESGDDGPIAMGGLALAEAPDVGDAGEGGVLIAGAGAHADSVRTAVPIPNRERQPVVKPPISQRLREYGDVLAKVDGWWTSAGTLALRGSLPRRSSQYVCSGRAPTSSS